MATIAIVPSDVPSKRRLADRLAARLVEGGHRVELLHTAGAAPAPIGDGVEHRSVPLRPPTEGIRRRWRPVAQWRAYRAAAKAIDPARLAAILERHEPDVVIVDVEEYEALLAALALGPDRPTAALCSFFEVWPIPGVGPNDPGPPGPRSDRVRARLSWWALWARLRLYGVRQHVAGRGTDRIAIARVLARRLGVRHRVSTRQWLLPFAPVDLPMIVCNALELDVPHEPRPGVRHVGSLLDREPVAPDDRELVAFVDAARADGHPLVVCAFGAVMMGERAPLVERLAAVAALRPAYRFVVATADDATRAALATRPNVHAASWIPQRWVLESAAAAIVHAGNATLHECVAARVPCVVYPFAVNDQPRNAARVARHGIGEVGDRDADTADTIAQRLDRVMGDAALRARLDLLAGPVLRYEHDGVAVAEVEALAGVRHVSGDGRTPS